MQGFKEEMRKEEQSRGVFDGDRARSSSSNSRGRCLAAVRIIESSFGSEVTVSRNLAMIVATHYSFSHPNAIQTVRDNRRGSN